MGGVVMNILPSLLLATLVCVFLFLALRNRKERKHANDELIMRVKHLRLYKMLEFLGADQNEFLRVIPGSDIKSLVERCSSCNSLEICDRCLRDGYRIDSMSFCPNYQSLCAHSKVIFQHRITG